MNNEKAKLKIQKLVERYKKLSDTEKKRYNEQQTKDHFIRPLFEALGWDFEQEVWPETDVSGKRVDYAFKIDGITKFYLEAKAIPVNLDEERWAEQAINYSWHKSVPWVILTDFEGIKVFNTEWDEPDIQSCRYIEIPWTEFLTSEKLWWLSREAFQKGILDKKADEVGKRPKKIIDEQLAIDLVRWRELLFKELCGYNPTTDHKKVSEFVQKILDRLIFIRTLEDRKIEDVILQPLVRDWQNKKIFKANQLLFSLNKVFRKIDRTYNSGLFEKCACDFLGEKIEADDNTFVDVINELYRTKNKHIRYNFADIPADIFGNIYEQYLGYIQKEDTKTKKTSKRKSQGIYYTPRYIVNYIIQNTLGEVLKSKTPAEIKNLKILDPACGSGSFLISAYQSLIDYSQNQKRKQLKQNNGKLRDLEKAFKKRNGKLLTSQEKMRILLNNIFGVDLDKEAVELAKLNLLLKMVNSQIKLPKLSRNIQEGNSLISGSEKELKKYFGRKWKDKKAFEWEEEFRDVFGNKGLQPIVAMDCAYHITWVTHNSRISQRMIEYKVKKGPGLWLDEKDEIKIAGFIRDIVKEDGLRVLAFNICGDHVHMFLVCAPDELSNIVRKLKGKSAQKYKEYLQIKEEGKFHLWTQKFSKTIIRPSREGNNLHRNKGIGNNGLGNKGLQPLVAENIHSHFHNTIKYIQRNREKHNLPNNKELQLIIADMLIGNSHINHNHTSNSNSLSNKGLQPLVAEAEAVAGMAGTVCDIDSAFAPQYKGGFDVIIGNPPWGADIDDDIKYLEDHYPNSTKQHKDIYKIFIEKAMQLLKNGGIFGFIIPNTILLQPRFKDVRQFLNQYKLLHIINLGERVFEGVEAPSCVIICEKSSKPKNHKVKVFDLSFSKDNELKADELRKCKYSEIAQSDYDKSPGTAFVMQYKKLERDEVILDEVLDIKDAGINYQRVKVGMQEKGKSDLAKRLLYEGQQENELDKMYYKGEDIDRYFIKDKTKRFVKTNYKDFIKNNEVVRLSEKFYKVMPKIIWRQTADRIIATLDNRGVWFGRSIQGGILKKEYENKIDLRYLIVLLNSKYFNYLYTQLTKESGRIFPQVKLSKVKQLPIKIIPLAKQKPFIKLADKMLKLNKELQKFDPIMDDKEYKEIEEEIERTDGEIDERVFGIYSLTNKEIKIIQ